MLLDLLPVKALLTKRKREINLIAASWSALTNNYFYMSLRFLYYRTVILHIRWFTLFIYIVLRQD